MAEYLHPGVYVEEVPSGVRPIEGVSTSTAGFIGVTAKGVPNKATFITSWSEFVRKFGYLIANSHLPYAVSQFFANGGKRCYVVRVLNEASAKTAEIGLPDRETDRAAPTTLTVRAKGAGAWGEDLMVKVEDGTTNRTRELKLIVYHEGEIVELFDDLNMDPTASNYAETEVNDVSEYIEVDDEKVYAVASKAELVSNNALADPVPLDTLNLILESADGNEITVDFTANLSRTDLVDRLNSEWAGANVSVSLDSTNHLVITHNSTGYDNYFRIKGTGAGNSGSGDPVEFDLGALPAAFAQGSGPAAPAVLKSAPATGTPATYPISDGETLSFTVTTTVGAAPAITYTFQSANNGGSTDWAPAMIAGELEKLFRDSHNGILKARTEGTRVVVESANRGRHDSNVAVTGAANATLDFAVPDRSGATADGQGVSEAGFLQSAEGPFTLPKDGNFYIVVNNDDDGAEYTGTERIMVNLTDAHINNFQQATVDEVVNAINAAQSEDTTINASTHILATAENNRVVIRQKQKGNAYSIRAADGLHSPNIRLKFQGQRQYGFVQGDKDSPYHRPALNTVAGVNEPYELTGGTDGSQVTDFDYVGTADKRTGLHALDDKTDVNFIAIPGRASAGLIGKAVGYCTVRKDCFFIADSPGKLTKDTPVTEPPEVQDFLLNQIPTKTSYGALYYPWLEIDDPIGAGKTPRRYVPPSGFVAGLYARIDNTRGVWKAAAGTEATVVGALDLEYSVTDAEQDILNPYGVNCLREFPASGIVIWGARTLGTQSDPEWRYIPVRRYAIYLEVSIYRGTQWAVFEPNDETLWESLRANIEDFMMGEFRKGALAGATPDQAFFVKCDADLNPPSEVNAGRVNVEVGFAPLKPAEFVVIRISQKTLRPEG